MFIKFIESILSIEVSYGFVNLISVLFGYEGFKHAFGNMISIFVILITYGMYINNINHIVFIIFIILSIFFVFIDGLIILSLFIRNE